MASPPAKPPARGKENVFTRKIGPLPMWVWVAVIAAVILLYVLMHKKKTSSGSSGSGGGQKTGGFGASLVPPVILHGGRGPRGPRGRRGRRGRRGNGDDDDQESDPAEGHEPHWRRNIRTPPAHFSDPGTGPRGAAMHDGHTDTRAERRRTPGVGGRPGDEDKAPRKRARREMIGGRPAEGELVSFTTAGKGPTPSLAQVASRYNTAPDAIIEEATGRGSPHGAMWRRYVAASDWQAPLPHGTDMTVLARPR